MVRNTKALNQLIALINDIMKKDFNATNVRIKLRAATAAVSNVLQTCFMKQNETLMV